jgi:hypothetical protein
VGKGGENARGRLHGYFKEALDTMVQIEWLEISSTNIDTLPSRKLERFHGTPS